MGFLYTWNTRLLTFIVWFLSEVASDSLNCTQILASTDITTSAISCNFDKDTCGYTLSGRWQRTKSYSYKLNTISTGIDKSSFVVYNRNISHVIGRSVISSPELKPGTYCLSFYVYTTNIFEALVVNTSTGHNVTHELKGKINSGWQLHTASINETRPFKIEFNFIQETTIFFGKYETMGIDNILLVQTSGIGTNQTAMSCRAGGAISKNGTCNFDAGTCGYTIQGHFERKTGLFDYGGNVVNKGHGVNSSYIVCNWEKIGASTNNTLTSPVIPAGTYCLTFWYYFTGTSVGLSVYTSSGTALFANISDPETTHAWTQVSVSVSVKKPFRILFQMLRAKGFFNQLQTIALDDITLSSIAGGVCTQIVPTGRCSFKNCQSCSYKLNADRWKIENGPFSLFGRSLIHSGQDDEYYALFEPFKQLPGETEGQAYDMESPELDPGHYCLSFWYALPNHYSNMSILVSSTYMPIWNQAGVQKNWTEQTLNITQTVPFKIVFRCQRFSRHFTAFVGIDNIKLSKEPGSSVQLTTLKTTRLSTLKTTKAKQTTNTQTTSKLTTAPTAKRAASKQTKKSTITSKLTTKTTAAKPTQKTTTVTAKPTTKRTTSKLTSKAMTTKPTTKTTITSKPTKKTTITSKQTTKRTTAKPTTKRTTAKPTTKRTTAKPTTKRTTAKPTTKRTTAKPTTKRTTAKPTTKRTTAKPTTKAITTKPTTKTTITSKPTKKTTITSKPTKKTTITSKQTTKRTTAKSTTKRTTANPNTKRTTAKPTTKTAVTSKLTTKTSKLTSKTATTPSTMKSTTPKPRTRKSSTTKRTTLTSTTHRPSTLKTTTIELSTTTPTSTNSSLFTTSHSKSMMSIKPLSTKTSKTTKKPKHTKSTSASIRTTHPSSMSTKHTTQKADKKSTKSPKVKTPTTIAVTSRSLSTLSDITTESESTNTGLVSSSTLMPTTSGPPTYSTSSRRPTTNTANSTSEYDTQTTESVFTSTTSSDTTAVSHREVSKPSPTTVHMGSSKHSTQNSNNSTTSSTSSKTSTKLFSTSARTQSVSNHDRVTSSTVTSSTSSGQIGGPSQQTGGGSNAGPIAGGVIGALLVIALVVGLFFYLRMRQRRYGNRTPVMDDQTEPTFDKSKRNSNNLGLQPIGGQSMDPKNGGLDLQPENGYTDNVRDSTRSFENLVLTIE